MATCTHFASSLLRSSSGGLVAGCLLLGALSGLPQAEAATVTLIKDFDVTSSYVDGVLVKDPVKYPEGRVTAVGTGNDLTLWFTTTRGGFYDQGALVTYKPSTGVMDVVGPSRGSGATASEGFSISDSGVRPNGDIVQDGDLLYYTTGLLAASSAGGTLNVYNKATGQNTVLWESERYFAGSNGDAEFSNTNGSVAIIDRGAAGKDIYFTTAAGGTATNATFAPDPVTGDPKLVQGTGTQYNGGILKYNTLTNTTVSVHDFAGFSATDPENLGDGRQAYSGFVQVGNRLYYTTYTGGAPATLLNATGVNGAGTVGYVDITTSGSEIVKTLVASELASDLNLHFPYNDVTYDAARNSLFFTTYGANTNMRGALLEYSLDPTATDPLDVLHEFGGSTDPTGAYPRTSVVSYGGALYYVTSAGGTGGRGVIGRYILGSEFGEPGFIDTAWTYAFDSQFGAPAGGLTLVEEDGVPYLYVLATGSSADWGALLRVNIDPIVVPEPSRILLAMLGGMGLFLRRRRARAC